MNTNWLKRDSNLWLQKHTTHHLLLETANKGTDLKGRILMGRMIRKAEYSKSRTIEKTEFLKSPNNLENRILERPNDKLEDRSTKIFFPVGKSGFLSKVIFIVQNQRTYVVKMQRKLLIFLLDHFPYTKSKENLFFLLNHYHYNCTKYDKSSNFALFFDFWLIWNPKISAFRYIPPKKSILKNQVAYFRSIV